MKNKVKDKIQESISVTGKAVSSVGDVSSKFLKNSMKVTKAATKKGIDSIKNSSVSLKIEDYMMENELKKEVLSLEAKKKLEGIIEGIEYSIAHELLSELGSSPLILSESRVNKIKSVFPIPKEQTVIWADAEFDLRPSGIALTQKGVYIRSNTNVIPTKEQKETNSNEPELFFYEWGSFNPAWFSDEEDEANFATKVEHPHQLVFIEACNSILGNQDADTHEQEYDAFTIDQDDNNVRSSIVSSSIGLSAIEAVLVDSNSSINTKAGHGVLAEHANNQRDILKGLDAKVVGGSNVKNGADRIANGKMIQTKYYKTARGTLDSSFDATTGNYRYLDKGAPMQLEVPSDQYDSIVEMMKKKILNGDVEGVTNPKDAYKIVKKGSITYQQSKNIAKAGNIDSLKFDAQTGAIICLSSFGVSFVITTFLRWKKDGQVDTSVKAGIKEAVQTSSLSLFQHIAIQQTSRTYVNKMLINPTRSFAAKIGSKNSAKLVNSIRVATGKNAISGQAAQNHLAKVIRTGTITTVVTMAVLTIPDTYKLASRKISSAQYSRNTLSSSSGLVGAIAGGKVGLMAGSVVPGGGQAIGGTLGGLVGGAIGGTAASSAANTLANVFYEDDMKVFNRMFNMYVMTMIVDYLLDELETDSLMDRIAELESELKLLSENTMKSDLQENTIREFLNPVFEKIVSERGEFILPNDEEISELVLDELIFA